MLTPEHQDDYQEIANTLHTLYEKDQTMRKLAIEDSTYWDPHLDHLHTAQLQEIITRIGWPTITKVGEEAATHAWILAQHADHDLAFQKICLQYMQDAGTDVNSADRAMLEDRISVAEGRPQRYGSQFTKKNGVFVPFPIEDLAQIETYRASVGLEPFAEVLAYYASQQRITYHAQTMRVAIPASV